MANNDALVQLAALQALYKRLGELLSTRDPDSLRGQVDGRLRQLYEEAGVDRISITVDGTEVGKLTVRTSEPTTRTRVVVNDKKAMLDESRELFDAFVGDNAEAFATWAFENVGLVPDGCEVVTDTYPGGYAGTTLTGCRPETVLPMLGIGRVAGYLEEG